MLTPELQVLLTAAVVFLPLEALFPLHRDNKIRRKGLRVDLLHVAVSGLFIRLGLTVSLVALAYGCAAFVPDALRSAVGNQWKWLQFVELLLLSDFALYVAHRAVHAIPFLWRFHAVHHSSEQMDWLATFRVHPVDQLFESTLIAVPAVALGFSPAVLLADTLIYRVQSLLVHSNVRVNVGLLNRVIATPAYHHWHHSNQAEAYDKNFGGQLTIWDRLFGTLYEPEEALPRRYGVDGGVPDTYVAQLVWPFRRVRRTAARRGDAGLKKGFRPEVSGLRLSVTPPRPSPQATPETT